MKDRQPRHFRQRASRGAFSNTSNRLRSRVQVVDHASIDTFAPKKLAPNGGEARAARAIIDPVTRQILGWLMA